MQDLNYRVQCPDCRNPKPNLVEDFASGDLICRDCGLVVGDRIIDTRSEWRTFSSDSGTDDPSRVGGPSNPLLEGNQLDTMINEKDGGTKSRDLNRTQSRAAMRGADKNLVSAYREIGIMCDRINLTKQVADQAKEFYKIADGAKLTKGKSSPSLIAACIYTACRAGGFARSFKEICALTGVAKKEIGKSHKMLVPLIRDQQQLKTMSSDDFIARPCSLLGLGPDMQRFAVEVTKLASQSGCVAGKSPLSVAAAGIYLIYRNVQKSISQVIGVSESTYKNAFKEMHTVRHQIIPLTNGVTKEMIEALPSI